jgi:hypothetical protein
VLQWPALGGIMKPALISAVVAAIVSVLVMSLEDAFDSDAELESSATVALPAPEPERAPPSLSFTDVLPEDVWVNAARTPGSDIRALTDAAVSVCYITKIEISGIQGPDDTNSCAVEIDDFTGFWQLIATVEEGGRSEIRCNARCLSWADSGE